MHRHCCVLLSSRWVVAQQPAAQIRIDTDRVIGEVDPHVFGNFAEHLGRCIYGGIFDEGSPLSDADGFRKDVMEAVKGLGVSLLRWPGGNFASGYNWKDGIGPRDQRPARRDQAWGAIESNRFGTDEFLNYAEGSASSRTCASMPGLGTVDEARHWVEYCNEPGTRTGRSSGAKNGREKPWNVKIWGLGNEIDGPWQLGHKNAEDYAKFALEAAKAMRRADDLDQADRQRLLQFPAGRRLDRLEPHRARPAKDEIDYISLHTYIGNRENNLEKFLADSQDIDERIAIVKGQIKAAQVDNPKARPIYIAFDEWNVWYRAAAGRRSRRSATGLEEHYNFEDALAMGMFINSFLRHANIVKMANLAQLVNVIAPIFTNKEGLYLQTIYFPLVEYAKQRGNTSLDVQVTQPDLQDRQSCAARLSGRVHHLQRRGSRDLRERSESQREDGYQRARRKRRRADCRTGRGLGDESPGPEGGQRFRQSEGEAGHSNRDPGTGQQRLHVRLS